MRSHFPPKTSDVGEETGRMAFEVTFWNCGGDKIGSVIESTAPVIGSTVAVFERTAVAIGNDGCLVLT